MLKRLLSMMAIVFALTVVGCGGGLGDRQRVDVPELGLSMYAPSGWRVDRHDPRLFFHGDSTGTILDEPLDGRVFGEYVRHLSEANMGREISSTPLTINGFAAIQAVIEYPNAGSKAMKVYIHKGDTLVELSLVTPAGDFSGQETAMRDSIASVTIQ